jgi:hypothetical protein
MLNPGRDSEDAKTDEWRLGYRGLANRHIGSGLLG